MEIFKLFGRILVENEDANRKIRDTDERAAKVGNTLANGLKTAAKWGAGIAAAAGTAGGALFALVNKVTDAGAAIDAKRKQLGVTSEALQEYQYVADQVGVSEDAMEKALGRLTQRMGLAERGNEKYAQSLKELGVTSDNTADAFLQAIETLHQMENAQDRMAAATDLFGVKLARDIMPIIEEGGESLIALRNRAHELGRVMDQDSTIASNNFQSALADVRGVLAGIAQDVTMKLLPTFERWAVWTADNIPKVWAVFQFVGEVIEIVVRHTSRVLEPWIELIGSILGVAWNWTVNLLGDAWDWLVNTTWVEKWEDIKRLLTAGWDWTIDIAGTAWAWLRDTTWEEKVEALRGWLSTAWSWTVDLAGRFWAWLDERAPWATETVRTIRDWLVAGWEWSVELAGRFWDWLDDRAPWLTEFLETVWAFIARGWTWSIAVAGSAWDWLANTTWAEKVEGLRKGFSAGWEWTINTAGAAWAWLVDTTWSEKLDDIRAWLSRAWTWTVDLAGDAWAWLEDHAPWLTDALSAMWGYIDRAWDWTLNLVGPAWEWLRDVAWPIIAEGTATVWSFSVDLLGSVWTWLRDTAWPVIAHGSRTAWAFTLELVGSAWEWLRDVAWPVITQGAATAWDWTMDAAGAAWDWITTGGWRETVQGVQDAFAGLRDRVVGSVLDMVKGVSTWFATMRDAIVTRIHDAVADVIRWFGTLRTSGLEYIRALAEGVQEWFGESKLGKTFSWLQEQLAAATHWFWEMYDRVVGRSYVPDMVEEIGEAIARLRERLANPVARYTASVIESFEHMEDEVVASMMSMAEAMDKVLDDMVNRVTRAIGDITREFWNGTATWESILHGLAGAIGDIFGSIFDAIAKELVANILAQNQWVVSTLANIATAITGFLSQAYATLVAFFAWSGPAAPVLAGGVIAAAIAAIASLGGSIIRGMLPDAPGTSLGGADPTAGNRTPSGGRQVSEITGPTRDLLTDLLTPLASLNTLTGIGERIYGLLDERLPMPMAGMAMAGGGPGGVTVQLAPGSVVVDARGASGSVDIDADTIEEIAERLAAHIDFRLRGTGR